MSLSHTRNISVSSEEDAGCFVHNVLSTNAFKNKELEKDIKENAIET